MSNLSQRSLTPPSKSKKKKNIVWIVIIIILSVLIIVAAIVFWLIGRAGVKKRVGDKCSNSGQCESTLACVQGFCADNNAGEFGEACTMDTECNNPLSCVNNVCQCPILSAPENIIVTGVGIGSINIEWDAVEGASGYIVYAKQDDPPLGDETDDVVVVLGNNITEYTFEDFPSLVEIHAAVKAFDDCGQGILSESDFVFDP